MLQGNAIANGCMSLHLKGVEIPKGFTPPLHKGDRYRLQLPENWYNHFSGFLMCAPLKKNNRTLLFINMKHEKGVSISMDSQQNTYWDEGVDDAETWVGYVSFGYLKDTLWWNPTSTAIEFYIDFLLETGFGVRLVSKTSQIETATDSFESSHDYKCKFGIEHDSKSYLKCRLV